jgi:drug/metabolite transporter (DMT)-like permease
MTGQATGPRALGWLPFVFVVIWSSGFVVARFGMPYAPPMSFLAIRFGLSFLCFLAWAFFSRAPWPKWGAQWGHLAVLGVLLQVGYLGGVWSAVKLGMGAGLAALIVCLQPIFTALWYSFVGSVVTRRQWVGLFLGLAGVVLVLLEKLSHTHEVSMGTLAVILVALASITAGTIYQKRHLVGVDVRTASTLQLGVAFVLSMLLATTETEVVVWSAPMIGAMLWSVLVLTLLGSSLLFGLIQRGAVLAVTSLFYLVPPTAAVMAWALFGENLTWATALGVLLTAVAVGAVAGAAPKVAERD